MAGVLVVAERALPGRGGLAVATSRIAAQAAARGEAVHLVTLSRDAVAGARGRVMHGDVVTHPVGALPREDESLAVLAEHARAIAVEHGLDLVHGVYATRAGYVATLVARQLELPSVVSLRGNDFDRGLFRAGDLPFLEQAVSKATIVTAVSRALAGGAERVFGRPVVHVTNSVDADAFRPERRDGTLARAMGVGDGAVLGFVGELREKKGMRFLLPAFADVLRRRPVDLLLIGGVRADDAAALAAFEASAPAAFARLHVVDYERDPARLSRLLALCDLLVFPSLFDGTPNAVLEAMAAARPVLATAVGGHLDLIEHGKSGALLPLADLDRLPQAVEELLDLPREELDAFGRAARERVLERHRPADESAAYAALYSEARSRSR